ncbi:MAG: hypothetical protein ACYDGN_09400 [Acidimicrobiales bacterium]
MPSTTDRIVKRLVHFMTLTLKDPASRAVWASYPPMASSSVQPIWPSWFLCVYPTLMASAGDVATLDILLGHKDIWAFVAEATASVAHDPTEILPEEGAPGYALRAMLMAERLDRIEYSFQLYQLLKEHSPRSAGAWDWLPWEHL